MEVRFAVAKVSKYAMRESGDTLEMIERPHGGLSMVLVDGQRSGRPAKAISNVVARKAVHLLAEGVRDGAAARAAHDYLYTYRGGKVSATLNILSMDIQTKTFVISRNNPAPVIVYTAEQGLYALDEPVSVVGFHRNVKPSITEVPVALGTLIVVFTDGLSHAGSLSGAPALNPLAIVRTLISASSCSPQQVVDTLLGRALQLEQGRPRDDISVIAMAVVESEGQQIRRLSGQVPL
ncbi:MAG: SpoIIE family protein phosphatase [Candidatus Promineifilaceae bacterium]|nr:SpoIIE family protein phosphatase [Candidatus Promineifilaceae bacterium]